MGVPNGGQSYVFALGLKNSAGISGNFRGGKSNIFR